jgi:hypothetical protein
MPKKINSSSKVQNLDQENQESKSFPKLGLLKTMQNEAESLIAIRKKAILIHNSKNINAAGNLVEKSIRDVLRKRLPTKFYVGQGHIVNPWLKVSPQFDIIIANNDSFPILFQDDDGTEWFPFEGVYAIGEVKSSYEKSKKPIEVFSKLIEKTKTELNWSPKSSIVQAFEKGGVQTQNSIAFDQLFSFMIFVDSSNFRTREIEEFYRNTPAKYLPNILYLVDKGVMLSMKFGGKDGDIPMEMNLYPEIADIAGLVQYKSKWCLRLFKDDSEEMGLGMAFFTFYYLLMSHLKSYQLPAPNLLPYYTLSTVDMGSVMNFDILD